MLTHAQLLREMTDAGESLQLTGPLEFAGETIPKVELQSVSLKLYYQEQGGDTTVLIRESNILDANGGQVSDEGELTLSLSQTDNVMISNAQVEWHVARITWTWVDGDTTRTGVHEVGFRVRRLAAVG